jgi:hypothetical protein
MVRSEKNESYAAFGNIFFGLCACALHFGVFQRRCGEGLFVEYVNIAVD